VESVVIKVYPDPGGAAEELMLTAVEVVFKALAIPPTPGVCHVAAVPLVAINT
jgi:hypothetical protein